MNLYVAIAEQVADQDHGNVAGAGSIRYDHDLVGCNYRCFSR